MKDVASNIPALSVEATISALTDAYCAVIGEGRSPKVLPSVMLWGPPGVGKSQAIRQIGKNIEERTHKRVCLTDVRLLLFNPIDLRGIPTANADKTLAIWLKPQIFQMDPAEDVVNILFLDEISAAPQSVQAAAYQITLDRVVGEHKLPDNCIVIAAGNRVTDKSVAFKMPKALANRLLHIEIKGSFESWLGWAASAGVNEKVMGFLAYSPDTLFNFDASGDDLAFATPRSWEMVSNLLNNVSEDVEAMLPMISGLVGLGTATLFAAFCRNGTLPRVKNIFNGTEQNFPEHPDVLYSVLLSMVSYAKEHKDDVVQIRHSLAYAAKFPPDYVAYLLKNYAAFGNDYQRFLSTLPEYHQLTQKCGVLRNGELR